MISLFKRLEFIIRIGSRLFYKFEWIGLILEIEPSFNYFDTFYILSSLSDFSTSNSDCILLIFGMRPQESFQGWVFFQTLAFKKFFQHLV